MSDILIAVAARRPSEADELEDQGSRAYCGNCGMTHDTEITCSPVSAPTKATGLDLLFERPAEAYAFEEAGRWEYLVSVG